MLKFQVHPVLNSLSDHNGQIMALDNLQVMRQVDCTRASREINEEKSIFLMGIKKRKLGRGL
jgi:hypothetical protein